MPWKPKASDPHTVWKGLLCLPVLLTFIKLAVTDCNVGLVLGPLPRLYDGIRGPTIKPSQCYHLYVSPQTLPVWNNTSKNWMYLSMQYPSRPTAASAYTGECLCAYFLKRHRMDLKFPCPWHLAFTSPIILTVGRPRGGIRASQTSNPFILNLKSWVLSIFWLHCYTKNKLTSCLRSQIWMLWD